IGNQCELHSGAPKGGFQAHGGPTLHHSGRTALPAPAGSSPVYEGARDGHGGGGASTRALSHGVRKRTNKKPRRQGGPAGLENGARGEAFVPVINSRGGEVIGDRPCICHGLYDHRAHGWFVKIEV